MRPGCREGPILGFLLLPCWFLDHLVQGQPSVPRKALIGGQVHLPGPNLTAKYKGCTWFFSADSKIVVRDSKGVKYFSSQLEKRVCLGEGDTLHIWDLQRSDSSEYILQLVREDGVQEERRVQLSVLDPVPTPIITVHDLRPQGSGCFLNLSCNLPTTQRPVTNLPTTQCPVTIAWFGPDGSLRSRSQMLNITAQMPDSYTCQANDTLSSSKSTVHFPHCLLAQSSEKLGMATWLLVLVLVILQALMS